MSARRVTTTVPVQVSSGVAFGPTATAHHFC